MSSFPPPDRLIRQIKEESLKKFPSHDKIKSQIETYLVKLTSQLHPGAVNSMVCATLKNVACLNIPWDQFEKDVKKFDYAIKCSKVWNTDYYGYRCGTCSLSPCMSLCGPCFQNGDHKGHDFKRFRSQSGGACDCGDPNVLKPMGFCCNHGIENVVNKPSPPSSLLLSARHVVPHLFAHLAYRFRTSCWPPPSRFESRQVDHILKDCAPFLELFDSLSSLGAAMQRVIREVLLDRDSYAHLMGVEVFAAGGTAKIQTPKPFSNLLDDWIARTGWLKAEDLYKDTKDIDFSCFRNAYAAHNFLDEFIFWIIRYRVPDQLSHSFLALLTEDTFRIQFAEAFCSLYPAMVKVLEVEARIDTNDNAAFSSLHNRFVHISVQLLSGAGLAIHLVKRQAIIEKLLGSIYYLLSRSTDRANLDMNNPLLVLNSPWPFMSDLQNLLSHAESMDWLLEHPNTQKLLIRISGLLQGMNMNYLQVHEHVEYELDSNTAFHLENELIAFLGHAFWTYPSWNSTKILNFLRIIASELKEYFKKDNTFPINCDPLSTNSHYSTVEAMAFSYHIPLHRIFACIMAIGMEQKSATLQTITAQVLDPLGLSWRHLIDQPLRVLSAYGESRADIWRRNGFAMSAQAFMYTTTNHLYTNHLHFVDHDLFLVQAAASQIPVNLMMCDFLRRFHMHDTRLMLFRGLLKPAPDHRPEDKVEGLGRYALLTLAWLLCQRTYCGYTMDDIARKNMVSALAVSERSHSDVAEFIPSRSGSSPCLFSVTVDELMRSILDQVAVLSPACVEESSGRLRPALYGPSPNLWRSEFDPLYLQLHHQSRGQNLQAAMNKYCQFTKVKDSWPPYRMPEVPLPDMLQGLKLLTQARTLHAFLMLVLLRYIDAENQSTKVALVTERSLSLAIFLIDLAVEFGSKIHDKNDGMEEAAATSEKSTEWTALDGCLETYFPEDNIFINLCHNVSSIRLTYFMRGRSSSQTPDAYYSEPAPDGAHLSNESIDMEAMDWTAEYEWSVSLPVFQRTMSNISAEIVSSENYSAFHSDSDSPIRRQRTTGSEPLSTTSSFNPKTLDIVIQVNKTLLSLLVRIHGMISSSDGGSRLRIFDRQTGAVLPPNYKDDFGNGAFYIERLLRKAALTSPLVDKELRKLVDVHPVGRASAENTKGGASAEAMETESNEAQEDNADAAVETKEKRKKRLAAERKERILRRMQRNADKFKRSNRLLMAEAERIEMSGAAESTDGPALETCFICGLTSHTMYFPAYIQVTKVPVMARRRMADKPVPWAGPALVSSSGTEEADENLQGPLETETRWQMLATAARGWLQEVSMRQTSDQPHSLPRAFPTQAMGTRVCMHVVCHRCREDMRWTKYPTPPDLCSLCRQVINHFIPCFDRTAVGEKGGRDGRKGVSAMRMWPCDLEERIQASMKSLQSRDAVLVAAALSHGYLDELSQRWWEWLSSAVREATEELQASGAPCRARLDYSSLSTSLAVSVVRTQLELEVAAAQVDLEPRMRMLRQKFHWEAVMRYLEVSSAGSDIPRTTLWQRIMNLFSFPEPKQNKLVEHLKKYPTPILIQEPEDCFVAAIGIAGKDKDQFELVLRACLNLAYIQALISTVLHFRSDERRAWCTSENEPPSASQKQLHEHLTSVYRWLRPSLHWLRSSSGSEGDSPTDVGVCQEVISPQSVEAKIQTCLLPLLRLAVVAWHRWWPEDGRDKCFKKFRSWHSGNVTDEFTNIVECMELSSGCLQTSADILLLAPHRSLDQALMTLRTDISIRDPTQRIWNYLEDVLKINRYLWNPPCLLRLPHDYDAIFLPAQNRMCRQCLTIPKESAICLVCGELLCFRQRCCRGKLGNHQNIDECAIHVRRCCRGTGIFLLIRSCSILIIHGLRMYHWGTLYLDHYGDEDLSMQRGRPLFLNQQRFVLLESQWLTHSLPFLPGRQWSNVTRLSVDAINR